MDTLTLSLPELLGTSPTGAAVLSLAEQFDALTDPEECFATAADAEAAGYRAPRK
jgi:hypothetical protein